MTRPPFLFASLALCVVAPPLAAQEDDAKELGWKNEAELSFVATGGNSETSSLGFGAKSERTWTSSRFEAILGGVRAESETVDRTAVFTDGGIVIREDVDSTLTAENYHAKARYDRDFAEDWFWHAGGSWERDEFAGIDHRTQAVVGIGHALIEQDDHTWRVDVGATWTNERLVIGGDESFGGLRLSSDWSRKVSGTTTLAHHFVADANLDDTDDYRADTKFSAQVAMSRRLALKAALQVKFDNVPALEEIQVVDDNGDPVEGQTLTVPLDDTDSKATVSLVVNF